MKYIVNSRVKIFKSVQCTHTKKNNYKQTNKAIDIVHSGQEATVDIQFWKGTDVQEVTVHILTGGDC